MGIDSYKLRIWQPLSFLLVFISLAAVLVFSFSSLSELRKSSVYQKYSIETNMYIDQNRSQLITLFHEVFPSVECVTRRDENISCAYPNQETIARLLPSTLKDWSSTVFIKKDGDTLLMMRLSGDTKQPYIYQDQKRLVIQKLLSGEKEEIAWDDYLVELTGKEVVVTVEDYKGNVIGAIVRSVIEAQ